MQSAFARFVLNKQLRAVALENPAIADKGVQREEAEWVFNDGGSGGVAMCQLADRLESLGE